MSVMYFSSLAGRPSFNRTIVELKYEQYNIRHYVEISFNRTIVELKYLSASNQNFAKATFNRTIVELKWLAAFAFTNIKFTLLIELL